MRLCIPVTEDKGLASPTSPHFGSAPLFVIIDSESGASLTLENRCHGHGICRPLELLAPAKIEGVIVSGIGPRALDRLQRLNLRVLVSHEPTVERTLAAFSEGLLEEATPSSARGRHRLRYTKARSRRRRPRCEAPG